MLFIENERGTKGKTMGKAGKDFIFCGNCGEKCKLPAKFCGVCGFRLEQTGLQQEVSEPVKVPVQPNVQKPTQDRITTPVPGWEAPSFDDEPTEFLFDTEEERTLLLDPVEEVLPLPVIIRVKTNEMTVMGKQLFRMGASKYDNELTIKDNVFVSRWHAEIIARNGKYYLRDKNSKNKTYVDGTALVPGQEVVLASGSRFKLADEEFLFEIE